MTTRHDDDERDAHLRAALRHAPDRDATPPSTLSEQILAAARRSVSPARDLRPPARRWRAALAAAIDALTKPAGAAAFASVVLATVIGVMWREGEPPQAVPERAAAPGTAPPAPSMAQAPTPTAPVPSVAAPLSKPGGGATGVTQEGAAATAAPESKRRAAPQRAADARQAERARAAPPQAATTHSDVAPPGASARAEARSAERAKAMPPAAQGAPTPASPAEAKPATAPQAPSADAAAAPALPPATAAARAAPMAAAPAAPAPLRSSLAPAVPDPIAGVALALEREAGGAPTAVTHRWQRGAAAPVSHGPAAQVWLAELQRATQGTWHAAPATTPGSSALMLSSERGVVAHVELTDSGVLWHQSSAPRLSWRAALPDETLKRLRESLAVWAGR